MKRYLPPLSVVFVWHPADSVKVKKIVEFCSSLLSRENNMPFSRSMNLPVFYCTTSKKGVPLELEFRSEKTIIFVFIGKEVAADDDWVTYIENIPKTKDIQIIPIALDDKAYVVKGSIDKINFIRAYEFEQMYLNDYLFISIAHEIYRFKLNESFEEKAKGRDNALKIFLSHAKDGKSGIKLAKALKEFIDNSQMRNFFDTTDIASGYRFDEEIINHIKESSIIAINSDSYSSRYWCQREILCAKEYDRPIIAVDMLEEFEDRRFPFASNVPSVRVHIEGMPTKKDLLRILSTTLLETVRFFYSKLLLEKYRQAGWIKPEAEIRSRPPEVADIEKLLFKEDNNIIIKHRTLIYPEPPLYSEELSFLSKLGIQLSTPLTSEACSLQDKRIGISISELTEEELCVIGQSSTNLVRLSQDFARYLLARGAILVYGGDLREGGFTEFLFEEALTLQNRLQSQVIHLTNYIAWPIYINDTIDIKNWKAKYRPIARMIEVPPPADIKALIPSEESFLPPTNAQNSFVWSRCLTEMRNIMLDNCNARICAGGRHSGYKGKMPGVLEEIIIALEKKCPLFLLGGFGGVTASVCKLIQYGVVPQELTQEWQIQNNVGYKELLDLCSLHDEKYSVDYTSLEKVLKDANLNNGLSKEDNEVLLNTPFIDEAIYLVLKGLNAICG